MADSDGEARETPANDQQPPIPPAIPVPAYPPFFPPPPPPPPAELSAFERWRVPLIVALVTVFIVFGILDVSSVFFHPAQNSGTTRPLVVNAQIVADATPATHPDLGLAPDALTIACGKTSRITVTNRSERPLQWTVTSDSDALAFSADTPRSSLLAPGQSIVLTVMAFSQPGAYVLHFTDDHGESADMSVRVSC